MKWLKRCLVSSLFLAVIAVQLGQAEELAEIENLLQPVSNHYSSGQPTAEQFQRLAGLGVKHIINFRPHTEQGDFNEAQTVSAAGMRYHHIPVSGPADLTADKVRQLDEILKVAGSEKVAMHCASGNRVGAMMALRANWLQGQSADKAFEQGKAYGLTRLESAIKPLMK
jgi:uncharacterized protein (TIGR01244 family)